MDGGSLHPGEQLHGLWGEGTLSVLEPDAGEQGR